MNKRGFLWGLLDDDIFFSTGVMLLTIIMEIGLIGSQILGKKMGLGTLPIWQTIIVMLAIPLIAYWYGSRG